MNNEFHTVTGFGLLKSEFDTHQGYTVVEWGNDIAIVFRISELDMTLSKALIGITGRSPESLDNRNVAEKKEYAELYNDIRSRLRVPPNSPKPFTDDMRI